VHRHRHRHRGGLVLRIGSIEMVKGMVIVAESVMIDGLRVRVHCFVLFLER